MKVCLLHPLVVWIFYLVTYIITAIAVLLPVVGDLQA